jgi:hypothetical protein
VENGTIAEANPGPSAGRSCGQAPGKIDADDRAADVAREEPPLALEPAADDDVLVRIARKEAELRRQIVGG